MFQEPVNPEAREAFNKAIEASMRGDSQAAILEFSRAIKAEPTCALLYSHLALSQYCTGRLQESLSALNEAIRLEPRFAAAYLLREDCHERLGNGIKAMADRTMGLSLPEPRFLNYPTRFFVSLYSEPFLREAREIGVNVEALLGKIADMPDARILKYPNGTIQLEGEGAASTFGAEAGSRVSDHAIRQAHIKDPRRMPVCLASASFASLSPFPVRYIGLTLWGEFVKQYEGGRLRVQPSTIPQPVDGKVNGPIENLPVTIAVRRRFSKQTRQQFADLVGKFLASVRSEGMFGEGPISRVSEVIDFFPRVAQFRIDASRSGQNTINWLILSLVEFSSINCVTEIHFTEQLNAQWTLEQYFELSKDKLVKVPIPEISLSCENVEQKINSADIKELKPCAKEEIHIDEESENEIENHASTPYAAVSSDYFPVLQTPFLVPDDLTITVFFEELPKSGERQPFADSIRSWICLGELGDFGTLGFGFASEIEYDTNNESLYFLCDLGTTDMDLAIRILVNTLEGWQTHGIVIKSLVLGKEQSAI
jgi:hypothetical protein